MSEFTNEELDELNLGKNFRYPDISGIETDIIPTGDLDPVVKIISAIIILFGLITAFFLYLRSAGMSIASFFNSLKNKIRWTSGTRVSSSVIIVPK